MFSKPKEKNLSPKKKFSKKKKFGLLILFCTIIYIFRVPLLSPPITWGLEKIVKQTVGLDIEIQEFKGTYFTGISLHSIQIKDGGDLFQSLDVEEVSVQYNPLFFLEGGRILTEVRVIKPKISAFAPPSESVSPENSTPFKPIDLSEIWGQIPDIIVEEAHLVYEDKTQGIHASIRNLSLHHTPEVGKLQVAEILAGGILPQEIQLSDFLLAWSFQNKKLTITDCQVKIEEFPEKLNLEKPVVIDLKTIGAYPVELDFPLPGGKAEGNLVIDLEKGAQVRFQKLSTTFSELQKTLSFLTKKELDLTPGGVYLNFGIDLPYWDLRSLRGRLNLNILSAEDEKSLPPTTAEIKKGFTLLFKVAELGTLTHLVNSLSPIIPQKTDSSWKVPVELQGGIYAQSHFQIEEKKGKESLNGNFSLGLEQFLAGLEGNFKGKRVAFDKFYSQGKWQATWPGKLGGEPERVNIPEFKINWDDVTIFQLSSQLDLSSKIKEVSLEGEVDFPLVEPLLKLIQNALSPSTKKNPEHPLSKMQLWNGSIHTDFHLKAKINEKNIPQSFQINLNLNLGPGDWKEFSYQNISLDIKLKDVQGDLFVERFVFFVNGENVFEIQGKVGYQKGRSSDIFILSKLQGVLPYLKMIIPELESFSGDLQTKVHFKGELYPLLDVKGQDDIPKALAGAEIGLEIQLQEGKWQKFSCQNLLGKLQLKFEKGDFLKLEELSLTLDEEKLIDSQGKFHYPSKKFSLKNRFFCSDLSKYASFIPPSAPSIRGALKVRADFNGKVPFQIGEPFLLHNHLQVLLENGQVVLPATAEAPPKTFSFEEIKFQVASKLKGTSWLELDQLELESCTLQLNKENIFRGKGKIYPFSSRQSQLQVSLSIKDIEKHLENFLPPEKRKLSGNFRLNLLLQGKIEKSPQVALQLQLGLFQGKIDTYSYQSLVLKSKLNLALGHLRIPKLQVLLDKNQIFKTTLDYNYQQENPSLKIDSAWQILNIERYWPLLSQEHQEHSPCAGNLQGSFQVEGIPPFHPERKPQLNLENPWHLSLKHSLQLSSGRLLEKAIDKLSFQGKINVNQEEVDISKIELILEQNTLVKIFGKVGYSPGSETSITCQSTLSDLAQYLEYLEKENSNPAIPINGDLITNLQIKAKFPSPGELLSAELTSSIHFENGKITLVSSKNEKKDVLRTFVIPPTHWYSNVQLKEEDILINKCQISSQKKLILELFGQLNLKEKNDIKLRFDLEKMINTYLAALQGQSKPVLLGKSQGELHIFGQIPQSSEDDIDLRGTFTLPFQVKEKQKAWQFKPHPKIVLSAREESGPQGFQLSFQLSGSQSSPKVDASWSWEQEIIRLVGQDFRIKDISLQGKFKEQTLSTSLEANIGGGKVLFVAQLDLNEKLEPKKVRLDITGNRLLLIRTNKLYGRADSKIFFEGEWQEDSLGQKKIKALLGGEVKVTEFEVSAYFDSSTIENIQAPPTPHRVSGPQGPLGIEIPGLDLELDLKIILEKISVHNNLVEMETKGNITVSGNSKAPIVSGWIRTTLGKLFLPQGVMNINECLIRLKASDPLVPYISLEAETKIQSYQVFVHVNGPVSGLEIEFSSFPPLPTEDVISLLVTGGTRSQLNESGSSRLVNTGISFLAQQFINSIGLGQYVTTQFTSTSSVITVSPPQWKGFALQGAVDTEGKAQLNALYRIYFK